MVRERRPVAGRDDRGPRATDLIGLRVVTTTGRQLGRVVDLVVARGEASRVSHLLVGPYTFLGRFSVLRHAARPLGGLGAGDLIPWSAVDRLERDRVTVRVTDDPEPNERPR